MSHDDSIDEDSGECVVPSHPISAEELGRYSPERDPHSEADIANYVRGQAPDESVRHVERVKREIILGEAYDIWDVRTDKDRWWVISNLTNLYSQRDFPSLDYTLSFHVGLMARIRSRQGGADADDPTPFDDVFRRLDQARARHDSATEAEDYQAVGMQLREALISLVAAVRRRTAIPPETERLADSDVVGWMDLLLGTLCPGRSNKTLRSHLRSASQSTWQLVNWLTHDRDVSKSSSTIGLHACQTVLGNSIVILERSRLDDTEQCPRCNSRNLRVHFDLAIGDDGDYYRSCGSCDWTDHLHEA